MLDRLHFGKLNPGSPSSLGFLLHVLVDPKNITLVGNVLARWAKFGELGIRPTHPAPTSDSDEFRHPSGNVGPGIVNDLLHFVAVFLFFLVGPGIAVSHYQLIHPL
ncbi:uncharacterized protein METZ01_LOCUS451586, partial [marine metagenome]